MVLYPRVIALCGESFVDRSDIDSAMIPKYCITALERFLYVARQPRALLSLLGVLYSGAEEEESGMNDHPEWISEMRRARLELAGKSVLFLVLSVKLVIFLKILLAVFVILMQTSIMHNSVYFPLFEYVYNESY